MMASLTLSSSSEGSTSSTVTGNSLSGNHAFDVYKPSSRKKYNKLFVRDRRAMEWLPKDHCLHKAPIIMPEVRFAMDRGHQKKVLVSKGNFLQRFQGFTNWLLDIDLEIYPSKNQLPLIHSHRLASNQNF
jgi:hypothetical protein